MENPPKLPPDVLQQLLAEARQTCGLALEAPADGESSDQGM